MGKSAQRQALVKVSGISGYFATKTGGATAAETTDVYDGGSLTPEKLASPPRTEDITVTRPFDPARDRPIITKLRPKVGRWRTTVSVQDTDADLVAIGRPTTYPNALLLSLTDVEVDAASGNPQTFELVFAVEKVA